MVQNNTLQPKFLFFCFMFGFTIFVFKQFLEFFELHSLCCSSGVCYLRKLKYENVYTGVFILTGSPTQMDMTEAISLVVRAAKLEKVKLRVYFCDLPHGNLPRHVFLMHLLRRGTSSHFVGLGYTSSSLRKSISSMFVSTFDQRGPKHYNFRNRDHHQEAGLILVESNHFLLIYIFHLLQSCHV